MLNVTITDHDQKHPAMQSLFSAREENRLCIAGWIRNCTEKWSCRKVFIMRHRGLSQQFSRAFLFAF